MTVGELIEELKQFPLDMPVACDGNIYYPPDSGYYDMGSVREVLLRSAVVLTVTQLEEIEQVVFTVSGKDLVKKNGELVGTMKADSFVDNSGSNVDSYTKVETTIYYADETGKKLKPYQYNHILIFLN